MKEKKNKKVTIAGYSIIEIFTYFIIYSIIGYILETIFGIFTKGILESRKGFLYGPFCPIYGLGGVVMMLSLKRFNKNTYTLFFGSALVGGAVEYLVSLIGEIVFKTKWWDYSDQILNINGRICLGFSLIWGFLGVYLMKRLHPKVEKFYNKLKEKMGLKVVNVITIVLTVFLALDGIMTVIGLKVFYARLVHDYDLDVKNKAQYVRDYEEIYNNDRVTKTTNKVFSNNFMLKTFPNLKLEAEDGSVIYVSYVLKDIKPYYIKLFTPKENVIYEKIPITKDITDKLIGID